LVNKVVLLGLVRDDLKQRSVLVEKQVRPLLDTFFSPASSISLGRALTTVVFWPEAGESVRPAATIVEQDGMPFAGCLQSSAWAGDRAFLLIETLAADVPVSAGSAGERLRFKPRLLYAELSRATRLGQ
ncbi:hypothetical protein KCU85_g87, partial [Aureobasidium melanogenum]